jgi:hypothetical protein
MEDQMQPIEGMARVQRQAQSSGARAAAQSAQQNTIQMSTIERMVVQEIDAWQRDHDAAHLLKAINTLQGMVSISAGMAASTAGVAAQAAGASNSWQPAAAQAGFSQSDGNIPIGGLAGAAQDAIDRAAEFAKSRVRNTCRSAQNAADRAARLLEDMAEAAAKGGAQASTQAQGGFGGRASGTIPGAPAGAQQAGGYGGQAAGGTQQGASQGGFGGRASGSTIRR